MASNDKYDSEGHTMAENSYDITIDVGSDYNLTITYTDPSNVPINISGASFEAFIVDDFVELNKLGTFNVSVTNAVSGQFMMTLPASVTSTLVPGATLVNGSQRVAMCGLYDVKMQLSGQTIYLLQGKVNINRMVTT